MFKSNALRLVNKSSDPNQPKVVEEEKKKPGDLGQEQAWVEEMKEFSDLQEVS